MQELKSVVFADALFPPASVAGIWSALHKPAVMISTIQLIQPEQLTSSTTFLPVGLVFIESVWEIEWRHFE